MGLCPLLFHGSIAYDRHRDAVHGDLKRFECATCDQKFTRKDNLKRHSKKCNVETVPIAARIGTRTRKLRIANAKTKAQDLQFNAQLLSESFRNATETWRITFNPNMKEVDTLNSMNASVMSMERQIDDFLSENPALKFVLSLHVIFVKPEDNSKKTEPPIMFNNATI